MEPTCLLVVDLAAVSFHRRAGVTTAQLADRSVLATCDLDGELAPEEAAAATLAHALENFRRPQLDRHGELVPARLGLYNPFSAQVEAAGPTRWSGGLAQLDPAGTVVSIEQHGGFTLDGSRFVLLDDAVGLSDTLTRAISAHG